MFDHILMTKFNLDRSVGARHRWTDPGWLEHRVELFEQHTLPSVRGQTVPPSAFHWLLFFHPQSPGWLIERAGTWSPAATVFAAGRFLDAARSAIRERLQGEWVITSRLDNDDALAPDYVARLQSAFRRRSEWLSIPLGTVTDGHRSAPRHQLRNPFISLAEPATELRTVWCANHNDRERVAPVQSIDGAPGWTIHVHERNLCNSPGLLGVHSCASG